MGTWRIAESISPNSKRPIDHLLSETVLRRFLFLMWGTLKQFSSYFGDTHFLSRHTFLCETNFIDLIYFLFFDFVYNQLYTDQTKDLQSTPESESEQTNFPNFCDLLYKLYFSPKWLLWWHLERIQTSETVHSQFIRWGLAVLSANSLLEKSMFPRT